MRPASLPYRIVEVANGTGTASRDSSQSASVPDVLAVAAGNDSSAILAAITDDESRSCGNDVAAPVFIPLNVKACLLHYNSDSCKTYKELGIFFKSALTVQ